CVRKRERGRVLPRMRARRGAIGVREGCGAHQNPGLHGRRPRCVTVGVPYLLFPPGARARLGGSGPLGALMVLVGAAVYLDCAWNFAIVGLGTPAIIDLPKRLVAKD